MTSSRGHFSELERGGAAHGAGSRRNPARPDRPARDRGDSMSVDVAALRDALAKATPGPWILSGELVLVAEPRGWTEVASCLHDSTDTADAELIVLLRNNAEALLGAEWQHCGLGPCSAEAGHEGKCVL